jgi:hypothetical protein
LPCRFVSYSFFLVGFVDDGEHFVFAHDEALSPSA